MDKQRRLKLAQILKSKGEALVKGVGDSLPPTSETAPNSPSLHLQNPPTKSPPPSVSSRNQPPHQPPHSPSEATAAPAPLDKGKRVVVLPSDDEEDSAGGQVFKGGRTTQAAPLTATSAISSSSGAESLREHPPSANSPPQPSALEGGTETEPTSAPPPATELPSPIQDSLRGFLERGAEGPKKEGIYYYMGAFMAIAQNWRDQAKTRAIEASTLQALEKEVAS